MIRVRQIFIDIDKDKKEELLDKVSYKLNISKTDILNIKINKKSIDARKKTKIHYVYEVDIEVLNENKVLKRNSSKDVFLTPDETFVFNVTGTRNMENRPVIVGSGPAGLFSAYFLSKYGYKPLIIERGESIENRVITVEEFWKTGKLCPNSNVQFGEGGAGTFSDGKLNTLVKDKKYLMKKVFEIFVECGAPEEIMYINNPHIGTDLLRKVVVNMRNKIIGYGGEFRYNTTLTDLIIKSGKLEGIVLNNKEKLYCDNLILAIGHSARDTFKMLYKNNLKMASKPFAVGVRVIHPQKMINKNQYGEFDLGSASYKLTYNNLDRGVYSFCMCPGGFVVNSSSEDGKLVVNGMSNYKRDSGYANSAIVVTVSKDDYGDDVFDGVSFQEKLEEKAHIIGRGNIPVQFFNDYNNNKISYLKNENINKMIKGNYTFSDLNETFPDYINKSLKEAFSQFDEKIAGFSSNNPLLLGVESRTSSPVKFYRDVNLMSNIKGIYPCGEGSGYAGGITTSAIDGIKVAEVIARTYNNK